jgi:TolB-like protein
MSVSTIAIAPFDNLSGDPRQDYFARGFVEDVVTELSRFGTLEVLHPHTVAASLGGKNYNSRETVSIEG